MDKSVKWYVETKINRTIENLSKNNIDGFCVKNEAELIEMLGKLIKEGSTVGVGGSVTLDETGVLDYIRKSKYNFLDRYKEGLTKDEIKDIYRNSFFADTYLTSTNAITEKGELFNIDGNGNRVAAMIYGPDQVIVICGVNKIVKDLQEAEERVKNYASPINAKRLNKNTPCAKVGYCVECNSEDRICCHYVVTKKQRIKGRIKVIIVEKTLGY